MKVKDYASGEYMLIDLVDWGHYPVPTIYVGDDPEAHGAIVEWIEPLEWHMQTWQNLSKALRLDRFGDYRYPLWTRALSEAMSRVFAEENPALADVQVEDGSTWLGDDEHGGIHFYVKLPEHMLELDIEDKQVMDFAGEFIAACSNLTDPGTFGSVYLFAEVARKLNIDWTDEVHEAGGIRGVMV